MTFTRFWAFLAVGLPVLAAVIAPFPSVDLAYHLRAGGLFLDSGSIPRVDTFTFTVAGEPWLNQQWLAEAILAAAYRLGGWTGLVVLRAMLVGVAFGLLFDIARRRAGSVRTAALLTLAAFVAAAITLGLRPQLFGVTIFAAVLWLLDGRDRSPRLVWLVVPLVAVWANVHGSFVLGPVLVGIATAEDLIRRRPRAAATDTLVLVASLAATFVNPFGFDVWTYAARISTNSTITTRITEWQRTSPLTPEGALFYLSLLGVAAVLVLTARRVPTAWRAALWLVPFAILGVWAVRGLAWWPFVAATTVAGLVADARTGVAPSRGEVGAARSARPDPPLVRRLNAVLAALLVIVGVTALPAWRPVDRGLQAPILVVGTAPSGITGALRGLLHDGDRILAPQPWGSWFEFALPTARVAVDSRIELFPDDVWATVDRIEAGAEGWRADLDRWDVAAVVTSTAQRGLADRLRLAGWRTAFSDDDGTVFVR